MEETGDLKVPQEEGIITKRFITWRIRDIVAGKVSGREDDKEVTLKSVGLAIRYRCC